MGRLPRATYRLQLQPSFGFAEAERVVPYLDRLGISDLYSSPVLTARPGSTHGYDVVDHSRVNPELGGAEGLARLADTLALRHMGLLIDVVPGHMCITTPDNAWWTDLLENGPSSPFADAFDIDWRSPNPGLLDRVLLPILGDQYGRVLEAGELQVEQREGGFWLRYQQHRLPLDPRTWGRVLEPALTRLEAGGDPAAHELNRVLAGLRALPSRTEREPGQVQAGRQEKASLQARLATLLEQHPPVRAAIDQALRTLNGQPGDGASFDRLDALLDEQVFRVAHWRVASEEINYRRFRDVNELAALRVEEPRVFDAVHAVLFELVREGLVTGLRVDCVDGLLDPLRYLRAVRAACAERSVYLVVEKVLSEGEALPVDWPVHGTTGYDFLNQLGGLLVDPRGSPALLEHYVRLTHQPRLLPDVAWECKKLALGRGLGSQMAMLARRLFLISEQQRHSRDFTAQDLTDALVEVVAALEVYRTYLGTEGGLGEEDTRQVDQAVAQARRKNPALPGSVLDFVRTVMVQQHPPGLSEAQREERRAFALRLQQLTAGVMARALEDTASYRFYPLTSQGEVGGDRQFPSVPRERFHQQNAARLARHPHALLATSTHDTKRGEDVRARIALLSEGPDEWAEAFERFHTLNQKHCAALPEGHAPDANEEYLFYQTLLGVWPFEPFTPASRGELTERLCAYLIKVLREAKVHSSWVNPNEAWEQAVTHFVQAVLLPATAGDFLGQFQAFAQPLVRAAVWSSLAQVLLKIGSPGVPDFYQGSELWDLNLVDPDNRRPVDFARREQALEGLLSKAEEDPAALVDALVQAPEDGRLKLYVTQRALAARRAHPLVFEQGSYVPLEALGPQAERVVAFSRAHEGTTVVVAVGRLLRALPSPLGEPAWGGTRLWLPQGSEDGVFRDAFTGKRWKSEQGSLRLADVFGHLPLALLVPGG